MIDAAKAQRLAAMDYVDLQVSLDGVDAETNDPIRGTGSYAKARRAMDHLAAAGFEDFKISVVLTRGSIAQLDRLQELAEGYSARLRLTRLRPSGRGVDVWDELRPTTRAEPRTPRLAAGAPRTSLTGDSLFHLNALGQSLPGLSMCGAGRIVCLVDPGRRRLRLPLPHPPRLQGRQHPQRRRLQPDLGRRLSCSRGCVHRPWPPVAVPPAPPSTCARAAVSRPRSRPVPRSTGPDPECVRVVRHHRSHASPAGRCRWSPPEVAQDPPLRVDLGRPRPPARPGSCSSRWARSSSTAPTCRWTPTRAWPSRWRRRWRPSTGGAGRSPLPCTTAPAGSTRASPARSPSGTETLRTGDRGAGAQPGPGVPRSTAAVLPWRQCVSAIEPRPCEQLDVTKAVSVRRHHAPTVPAGRRPRRVAPRPR